MSNAASATSKKAKVDGLLPDYGMLYFDHLITEFDYLIADCSSNEQSFKEQANDLIEKKKTESLSWNDLMKLELLIAKVLPDDRLSREVWRLRLRYRDVVGLKQYENYLASVAPDKKEATNKINYRADIAYLISEIYLRYVITPHNERLRDDISKKVTLIILSGLLIIICLAATFGKWSQVDDSKVGPFILLLVLFLGGMGGLLSMQQRYQNISRDGDPIDNLSVLQQGWSRMFVPAISGGIFAVLLCMLVGGGLIQGDLFPTFTTNLKTLEPRPAAITNTTFKDTLAAAMREARPINAANFAKLVVWSFLAGFAERFVPDTLSRFISTKETTKKDDEQ